MYDTGNALFSWITFDTRKFIFNPPQGSSSGSSFVYNIRITLKDVHDATTTYKLILTVKSMKDILFKTISNVKINSPQQHTFR